MTPQDIMAACPTIYPTVPRCGFDCPRGWLGIVERLSLAIEVMVKDWPDPPTVIQVKEKFGGLRFYMSQYPAAVEALILQAESESFRTCERCGNPGQRNRRAPGSKWWIRTLCDEHAAPPEPLEPGEEITKN